MENNVYLSQKFHKSWYIRFYTKQCLFISKYAKTLVHIRLSRAEQGICNFAYLVEQSTAEPRSPDQGRHPTRMRAPEVEGSCQEAIGRRLGRSRVLLASAGAP